MPRIFKCCVSVMILTFVLSLKARAEESICEQLLTAQSQISASLKYAAGIIDTNYSAVESNFFTNLNEQGIRVETIKIVEYVETVNPRPMQHQFKVTQYDGGEHFIEVTSVLLPSLEGDQMLPVAEWAENAGYTEKGEFARLEKLKAEGKVFSFKKKTGVTDYYPKFQFSNVKTMTPIPVMARILEKVPPAARGRPLLSWFVARNVFLDNRRPYELIDIEPAKVIDAADRFFGNHDEVF